MYECKKKIMDVKMKVGNICFTYLNLVYVRNDNFNKCIHLIGYQRACAW